MKTFIEIINEGLLLEKKDHLINKLNLTDDQKQEIIDFFSKHPNLENKIDWNRKELSYNDFKDLMTATQSTFRSKLKKVKQEGTSGIPQNEYKIIQISNENVTAYVPFTYDASRIIASKYVGGTEGKWCTAQQKSSDDWYSHTGTFKKVFIYFVTPKTKYAASITAKKAKEEDIDDNSPPSKDEYFDRDDENINLSTLLKGIGINRSEYLAIKSKAIKLFHHIEKFNNVPRWETSDNSKRRYEKNELHNLEGPAIIIKDDSGKITQNAWYVNGKLHRLDSPADIRYKDGKIVYEEWAKNGIQGREDGPSLYKVDVKDGEVEKEWRKNGVLHNENGPAILIKTITGKVVDEQWYINGKMTRDNGPAHTRDQLNPDGTAWRISWKKWYKDGKLHRLDGPAEIKYIPSNDWSKDEFQPIKSEAWYQNDKLHRTDGPAVIYTDKTGKVKKYYYLLNKRYSADEFKETVSENNHFLIKLYKELI